MLVGPELLQPLQLGFIAVQGTGLDHTQQVVAFVDQVAERNTRELSKPWKKFSTYSLAGLHSSS